MSKSYTSWENCNYLCAMFVKKTEKRTLNFFLQNLNLYYQLSRRRFYNEIFLVFYIIWIAMELIMVGGGVERRKYLTNNNIWCLNFKMRKTNIIVQEIVIWELKQWLHFWAIFIWSISFKSHSIALFELTIWHDYVKKITAGFWLEKILTFSLIDHLVLNVLSFWICVRIKRKEERMVFLIIGAFTWYLKNSILCKIVLLRLKLTLILIIIIIIIF